MTFVETDILEGYLDGSKPDSPDPSDNRSNADRHGFANGRDDLNRKPRASAAEIRALCEEAARADSQQ